MFLIRTNTSNGKAICFQYFTPNDGDGGVSTLPISFDSTDLHHFSCRGFWLWYSQVIKIPNYIVFIFSWTNERWTNEWAVHWWWQCCRCCFCCYGRWWLTMINHSGGRYRQIIKMIFAPSAKCDVWLCTLMLHVDLLFYRWFSYFVSHWRRQLANAYISDFHHMLLFHRPFVTFSLPPSPHSAFVLSHTHIFTNALLNNLSSLVLVLVLCAFIFWFLWSLFLFLFLQSTLSSRHTRSK